MPLFAKLATPSFDLTCISPPGLHDSIILIPGGGGASKTGVKNLIQLATIIKTGFQFKNHISTDNNDESHLCSTICSNIIDDHVVVCAIATRQCLVYSLFASDTNNNEESTVTKNKQEDEQINIASELQLSFLADPKESGCVNCCALTATGLLITAGDDGVIRFWQLNIPEVVEDENEVEKTPWSALLMKEMNGHTGSVMSLSLHPLQPWVASGSKDGTIKIWNYDSFVVVEDITCTDGLPGTDTAVSTKTTANPSVATTTATATATTTAATATATTASTTATTAASVKSTPGVTSSKLECRGCVFSNDGSDLLAIQSGKRGATHLVRWELAVKVDESFAVSVTAKPQDVLIVAKVPCTRLCGSSQHKRLAIGASDGSIIVINYDGIKLVKTLVQPCHELPVTGLSFAPIEAILHTKYDDIVISCSADYALCMIPVHGKSHVLFRLLFVLLSILALLGLWYVTLTLYSRV